MFNRIFLFAALVLWGGAVLAEDFRIESQVFGTKEKEPPIKNLTIFKGGIVYDYLLDSPKVVVFDQGQKRFVLLDTSRKIKSEVSLDEIEEGIGQLRKIAAASKAPINQFFANPIFNVAFVENSKELKLSSAFVNYSISTEPASKAAAQQFREFSDWFSQLNVMLDPHTPLPFPRIALNAELQNRQCLPARVRKEMGGESIHSTHAVNWKVLSKDDEMIEETGRQIANFRLVDFPDFRKSSK